MKGDSNHWLTDPEYATLRFRLEAAHVATEAELVEARRRVRLNEREGETHPRARLCDAPYFSLWGGEPSDPVAASSLAAY